MSLCPADEGESEERGEEEETGERGGRDGREGWIMRGCGVGGVSDRPWVME